MRSVIFTAGPVYSTQVLTRFQMGHLRTMFRLLDKDQDGLVSVTDLRFHYQSQGCVLSEHEATLVIDAVAVARKGYYVAKGKRGDIREVERTGFDFPELVAFCLWRVASEEPAAVDGGVGSGLRLDASARLAVCETAFVRLKGLDERVVEVGEHVTLPLSFDQFAGAVRRCRLDRGPFGVRSQETRLLFELLCMGHDGGDLRNGVEDRVSRACGAVFAAHGPWDADLRCPYEAVASFFEATVFCVHRTRSGHIDLGRGVHVDDGAGFPESPREPARENAFAAARKQGAFKLFHAVSSASSVGSDLGADAPGAPAEEVSVVAADEADGDAPPEASVVLDEAFARGAPVEHRPTMNPAAADALEREMLALMTTDPSASPNDDPDAPFGPSYAVEGYDARGDDASGDESDDGTTPEGSDIFAEDGDDDAPPPPPPDEPDRDAPPEQQPPEPRWYKPHTWFSPRKEAPKAAEVPPTP